jgi:hypothetical protein
MFLKKRQQKTLQPSSGETPRAPRYSCVARISIDGFEGEAVLRNINQSGFRMESKTYAAITAQEHCTIRINPEAASALKPFELKGEVRWIQSAENSFSAGFLVTGPSADRSFEKYIDYIKSRYPG